MRGARLVSGILAVLVVSGCATPVGGTAVAGLGTGGGSSHGTSAGAAAAAPASAARLLGELSTVDPCGLTDPRVFARFGRSRLGDPDSMDDCLVVVETATADLVSVYVGSLDRADAMPNLAARPATGLAGGLRVITYDSGPAYCNQLVLFSDGITLSVNASVSTGELSTLCDMVRAGVDEVVNVLLAGRVRHRDLPANSLGRLDPCSLVPADALAAVPELAGVRPRTYPARHGCAWTSAGNRTRVRVMFTAGEPPRPSAQGASEVRIADRTTVRSPTPEAGEYAFCGVQTGHIPFAAPGRTKSYVEIAAAFVRMPKGQLDAACRTATGIAAAVWPKLPRT